MFITNLRSSSSQLLSLLSSIEWTHWVTWAFTNYSVLYQWFSFSTIFITPLNFHKSSLTRDRSRRGGRIAICGKGIVRSVCSGKGRIGRKEGYFLGCKFHLGGKKSGFQLGIVEYLTMEPNTHLMEKPGVINGYLYCRKIGRDWKKRWCEIRNNKLYFFATPSPNVKVHFHKNNHSSQQNTNISNIFIIRINQIDFYIANKHFISKTVNAN